MGTNRVARTRGHIRLVRAMLGAANADFAGAFVRGDRQAVRRYGLETEALRRLLYELTHIGRQLPAAG